MIFPYSGAERCTRCQHRASLPDQRTAERLVAASGGRLTAFQCAVGTGWHLINAAVELRSPLSMN